MVQQELLDPVRKKRVHDLRGVREGMKTLAKLLRQGYSFHDPAETEQLSQTLIGYAAVVDKEINILLEEARREAEVRDTPQSE